MRCVEAGTSSPQEPHDDQLGKATGLGLKNASRTLPYILGQLPSSSSSSSSCHSQDLHSSGLWAARLEGEETAKQPHGIVFFLISSPRQTVDYQERCEARSHTFFSNTYFEVAIISIS